MLNPCVLPTVHEQHEIYHKANQHGAILLIANSFQHTSLWSNQTGVHSTLRILLISRSKVLLPRTFYKTEG